MSDGSAPLSARQREVCDLISHGFTNKEIGRKLGISHRTVEYHREEAYKKTGARSGIELVHWMFSNGTKELA